MTEQPPRRRRRSTSSSGKPTNTEMPTCRHARRTTAQIEKKRIQDRESQRNVRQRTKEYIANLEGQLEQLQSPSCISQLLAENDQLKSRVENLDRALSSISSLAAANLAKKDKCHTIRCSNRDEKSSAPDIPRSCSTEACLLLTENEDAPGTSVVEQSDVLPYSVHVPSSNGAELFAESHGATGVSWPVTVARSDSLIELSEASEVNVSAPERPIDVLTESYDSYSGDLFPQFSWKDSAHHSNHDSSISLPGCLAPFMPNQQIETWNVVTNCDPTLREETMNRNLSDYQINNNPPVNFVAHNSTFGTNLNGNKFFHGYPLTSSPKLHFDTYNALVGLSFNPTEGLFKSSSMIMTQTCPPTNIWDSKLLYFISQLQSLLLSNLEPSFFEPDNPDVTILLHETNFSKCPNPITRFLSKSINLWNFSIPEKLGIFWLNYIHLKYRVSPTEKNVQHIPEWFSPRASQCFASHPIFVDTLPWPRMRDKLTFEYESYAFEPFVTQFCASLNVNWTHDATHTYNINPDGSTTLSASFIAHLKKLENWTLTAPFSKVYPELSSEL